MSTYSFTQGDLSHRERNKSLDSAMRPVQFLHDSVGITSPQKLLPL